MMPNSNKTGLLCCVAEQGSDLFDVFWRNNSPWFETPNIRRGGWSGVVKSRIDSFGKPEKVFIKRQQNHMTRTIMHPIKGIPTFLREYHNIQSLQAKNIPTLEVLYFDTKDSKAVLITKALEGYISLDKIEISTLEPKNKKSLVSSIAKVIRHLHQCHYQHNCLYPKHIMIRQYANGWDVKLIDLEKLKYCLSKKRATIHDLATFLRHMDKLWSVRDKVVFFQTYFQQQKISCHSKKIINAVSKKVQRKAKSRKQFEPLLAP